MTSTFATERRDLSTAIREKNVGLFSRESFAVIWDRKKYIIEEGDYDLS